MKKANKTTKFKHKVTKKMHGCKHWFPTNNTDLFLYQCSGKVQ